MLTCVKEAKRMEREIFSKYITKCQTPYACSMVIMYIMPILIVLTPMIMAIRFPIAVEYPFSINNTSIYIFLYVQQIILLSQVSAHLCICVFAGLLIWFTAARFECLTVEFQRIMDVDTLIACVKKQLHLRR